MITRTTRYLANALRESGLYSIISRSGIQWYNFYIGDKVYNEDSNQIYMLTKTDTITEEFYNTISDCEDYVTDYEIDEKKTMFVFELAIPGLIEKFIKGEYSKLYTKKQISSFFPLRVHREVREVLMKSNKLKERIESTLQTNLEEDAELDSIINIEDELWK